MPHLELDFNPKPQPRCKNCGKPKGDHNARTRGCPVGKKHRVIGYTTYSDTKFFE